mmetsp:Transcript_3736/g.7544  ORF Transcript_3736/g.7544 Transcript_3736/m.7544 type:complete len:531 (+) Transcript_3736:134-1726(+)|eukprot:CAMPEP_0118651442 /NCGR_PEP_ID=MMETSP0785-20121206/10789_1 /TAXON_ID=91992 /ORGANISM="Bolidomonas pacifica, Strain CCMP 1866" /LENGTH=530 /DNA_ID=CAMNT_0006543897 /DNA_START=121 /DNA_END=1713 /DNA_ORIENTATION=-
MSKQQSTPAGKSTGLVLSLPSLPVTSESSFSALADTIEKLSPRTDPKVGSSSTQVDPRDDLPPGKRLDLASPRLDPLLTSSVSKDKESHSMPFREPQPPSEDLGSSKRMNKSGRPRKANKKWTKDEDAALIDAVNSFGEQKWKAIAENVGSRNHTQCLQRWKKVVAPKMKLAALKANQPPLEPINSIATGADFFNEVDVGSVGRMDVEMLGQQPLVEEGSFSFMDRFPPQHDASEYRHLTAQQLANTAIKHQQKAQEMENLAAAVRRGEPVALERIKLTSPKESSRGLCSLEPNIALQDGMTQSSLIDNELKSGHFYQDPVAFVQKKISDFGPATGEHAMVSGGGGAASAAPDGLSLPDISNLGASGGAISPSPYPLRLSSIDDEIKSMMQRHQAEQHMMQSHQQQQIQELNDLRLMKAQQPEPPQKRARMSHEEEMAERRKRIHEIEAREVAAAEAEMRAMGAEFPPDIDMDLDENTSLLDIGSSKHASRPATADNLFTGFDENGIEYVLGHPMSAWDDFFEKNDEARK